MSPDTTTSSSGSGPWFAISMGLLGLIIGYALATGLNGGLPSGGTNNPTPSANTGGAPVPEPTNAEPADADDDPMMGSQDATITLIEFTDYQCPFCSRHFEQTYPQLKKDYIDTGKVKYVLRDFPLSNIHPNAQKAAEASECADDQGKFWEMHDKLFTSQQEWSNLGLADAIAKFKQYAGAMGVNASSFASCLDEGKYDQEVKDDLSDGSAAGIDGTPGFWILGPDDQKQQISGAYPFDTFKQTFDGMLE
jgi:protein-disulfide isomerase